MGKFCILLPFFYIIVVCVCVWRRERFIQTDVLLSLFHCCGSTRLHIVCEISLTENLYISFEWSKSFYGRNHMAFFSISATPSNWIKENIFETKYRNDLDPKIRFVSVCVCVLILITLWLMSFRDGSRFFDAVLTLLSNLNGWIVAQEIFISIFQIFWLAPIIHQSNFISFFSFFETVSSWTRKFNSIFSHTVQRNNYELSIKITVIKMQTDCILSSTSIDAVHFCFIAS